MAGKKDNGVVAVITGLTEVQAAKITKDVMKCKKKYAPYSRGSIKVGKKDKIPELLQGDKKKLTKKKQTKKKKEEKLPDKE